ncbi:MAG: hypothetical protein LBI91_02510 [Spirochaetaceae bacterium]|jgi:hypothetical protein|nr:hypothetical protein [Spirochaetaceae bacterium]
MRAECEDCVSVLKAETELAGGICAMVMMVRRAVEARAWTDFELLMENLARSGAEFEALEQEREAVFAALAEKNEENGAAFAREAGFYALAARLPVEEQKLLTGLYRNLKLVIFKAGIENSALANYLNGIHGIVSDFIAAAFPDRRGKLYTRRGRQAHADMRSMVLNRQF